MPTSVPYQNPTLSPAERASDLISRMTLAEKVGQLMQLDGQGNLSRLIDECHVGSLLHINGEGANDAIDQAAKTRLGIPLLIADDCIHGHSFWPGATIFPSQLTMASSWDLSLLEDVARATALEVVGTGIRWTFSPVLCITRDLRWGRVGETFGEDPHLIGEMALAMIRGYQGKGLDDPDGILATAKVYAGYSETQGGRDASEADISERKLRATFLPPFEHAAKNGCMSFMTGYQSMDGLPSTANRWLLKTVLREEWGYEGILVTDWDNVGAMVKTQRICADYADAAVTAIRAGNDLIMATEGFFAGAQEAVERGLMSEEELDEPLRRILELKFRMGLFENPGRASVERQSAVGCAAHAELNLRAARESIVLLQNPKDILPLDSTVKKKIAVVGPNADAVQSQLGDWACASGQFDGADPTARREMVTTVLDGLRGLDTAWEVSYAKGCGILDASEDDLDAALALADTSDAVVAVVGDEMGLIGEWHSTATLELQGRQIELLDRLVATGTPLIVVSVASKPHLFPRSLHENAVIIEAFNPGMRGGQAVAELIAGAIEPGGRLTVSIPYHVGQQPIYYAQIRGQHGDKYADCTQQPHFAFGEGLSYTTFAWSEPALAKNTLGMEDTVTASVTIQNTGTRPGKEVVQAYVTDKVTSTTWYQKELKGFASASLAPGESQRITIEIPVSALSIINRESKRVVEPGEFVLELACSSRDPEAHRLPFRVKE